MAIAQSIVEQVRAIAEREALARVASIRLRIGTVRAVIPETLEFNFDVLSQGTPLQGARVEIEEVPIRVSCFQCGITSSPEPGMAWLCPACGSAEVQMISGKELVLESLEVED